MLWALALAVVALTATTAVTRLTDSPAAAWASHDQRTQAATWVAGQVSRSAILACDPAMCAALRAAGTPAGNLLELGPAAGSDPLGSDIVVATATVRSTFGARLADVYAPLVLASFGTGSTRVEIRVTAPQGAAAYLEALRLDQLARGTAGAQLLSNARLSVTPAARRALAGGRVDSRLLTTIAALAKMGSLRIIGFGDGGPGASPAAPLRGAEIAAAAPGTLSRLAAFLHVQRPPYLAARISLPRSAAGQPVLSFAFADPSPLGLLSASLPAAAPPAAAP